MSADSIFQLVNLAVLPIWGMLICTPIWKKGPYLLGQYIVPAGLGMVYIALVANVIPDWNGSFSTLDGVAQLFANRWMLLAGWTHYLAFELFIGSWQVRDSQRNNIPHRFVVPCLVLTLLFGPAGFVAYFCIRRGFVGRDSIVHATNIEAEGT